MPTGPQMAGEQAARVSLPDLSLENEIQLKNNRWYNFHEEFFVCVQSHDGLGLPTLNPLIPKRYICTSI